MFFLLREDTGHGNRCHGLVDEVLGHRLYLMASKVFSNLAHSMILQFCEPSYTGKSLSRLPIVTDCCVTSAFQYSGFAVPEQQLILSLQAGLEEEALYFGFPHKDSSQDLTGR